MEKILSQDEINALFSSMSADGAVPDPTGGIAVGPERRVAKYDFSRSDRIAKDQIRALQQLHANFARQYSASLSAYMRCLAEMTLVGIDQINYAEFLKSTSDPTFICALSLAPVSGSVAMELNPALVFPLIDLLLGGTGTPSPENRPFTDLEIQIMEGALKLALRDLKECWRPFLDVKMELAGVEVRPQMLQLVPPGEPVVVVRFEVKLGDISGVLRLCIPSVILKTNRAAFENQRRPRSSASEESEAGKIGEALRTARISLTSEIRDQVLAIEDLLNIGVGDVIQLNHALGDPVQLNVAGIPKFTGRIVARRGKRAFEITNSFVS
jgi:flagellar motor switch protein FliM